MGRVRISHLTSPALVAVALALVAHAHAGPGAVTAPDAPGREQPLDGVALLREALEVRHAERLACRVRLVLHDGRGNHRVRELETLTSHADGRMRTLGRVITPASLRGMTILTLEEADRSDDVFVYLPQFGRARRVAMSRRGDAFLGSDLSYDDLERQRAGDYAVLDARAARIQGEDVVRLVTRPRRSGAARVDFFVARSDRAILEIHHRQEAGGEVTRVVSVPRASIVARGRLRIPTRLRAARPARGTHTLVEVSHLDFDPVVDDRLFSIVTLEARRALHAGPPGERDRPETD